MAKGIMNEQQRPRIHIIHDIACDSIKQLFHEAGWVIVDLSPDYGEDQLVFVYENECATGEMFLVQIKAKSTLQGGPIGSIKCRIGTGTIKRWERIALPVVLVSYIADEQKAYWLVLSTIQTPLSKSTKGTKTISIPRNNLLTSDNLEAQNYSLFASYTQLNRLGIGSRLSPLDRTACTEPRNRQLSHI